MRSADLFVAAALASIVGCGGDYNLAGLAQSAAPLPTTVNCEDAGKLRDRASQDRRSSGERKSDQEKIDLVNPACFVARLATMADLRCKVSVPDADEIVGRVLDAARDAENTGSFYARTLKWQEAGFIANEALDLMIRRVPDPTAR